jgi:hypothetical protein
MLISLIKDLDNPFDKNKKEIEYIHFYEEIIFIKKK